MEKGIDVSKWQGEVDWQRVKESGFRFAMIKALQGKKPDPRFRRNAAGARSAGLPFGCYVYSLAASPEEAEAEAEAALELTKGMELRYPVAMDFESAHFEKLKKAERGRIITAFCERVKRGGRLPMLYSNLDWFTRVIPASLRERYLVWLACWRDELPSPGFGFAMWQRGSGSVPGIEAEADLDEALIDFAALTEPPASFALVSPRSRGEAYLAMQRTLNLARWRDDNGDPLKEDGVWGKKSREAFDNMVKGSR